MHQIISINRHVIVNHSKSWDDARDFLEAAYYFGAETEKIFFPCLKHYVLSENLDCEYNAFREAGVAEPINDDDVYMLAEYSRGVEEFINDLKRMGLKSANGFFKESGNNVEFLEETLLVLKSDITLDRVLSDIKGVRERKEKTIYSTYETIKECKDTAIKFLLMKIINYFILIHMQQFVMPHKQTYPCGNEKIRTQLKSL